MRSPHVQADSWAVVAGRGVGGHRLHTIRAIATFALFGSLNNRLNFFIYAQTFQVDASGLRAKRLGQADSAGRRRFRRSLIFSRGGARLDPRQGREASSQGR